MTRAAYAVTESSSEHRFVFGGVALELHPGRDVHLPSRELLDPFGMSYSVEPVVAHARCAVFLDPHLSGPSSRRIDWEWQGDRCGVRTARAHAELLRTSPGLYAGRSFHSGGATDWVNALNAVTAAICCREGGVIIHAAGVVVDDRAFLLIGPSGAGKSTAAGLCYRGRELAFDRAAVYPVGTDWYAVGLTGGEASGLRPAPRRPHRVGGIFRIRQSDRLAARPMDIVSALVSLRESTQALGRSADEERTLDSLSRLAGAGLCGSLHTVLGRDVTAVLGGVCGGS